ncbi:MAG TPA: TadE family protein [Candidatus Acidoferrales bacterium]|nr:TadE family protein [Candidatus Acidoferrales bacterium]
MRINRTKLRKNTSGQSLVETAIMLPMLLTLAFNALNFGYFFLIALNLAAAPRSAVEYSVQGPDTPPGLAFPAAGSATTSTSVSFLLLEDMRGAISANASNSSIQVCTQANGVTNPGTTTATATCTAYGASLPGGFTFPTPDSDPELIAGGAAPAFILNRVDVFYSFKPLIPGRLFNLVLMGRTGTTACSSTTGNCVFHRQASMRAM